MHIGNPFISDRKSGKATPGDSRVQEKTHTYVHHKTPSTLTTSLGRLLKSLNGDSKVFVSTFNITTSSSDLFFTLCLKNTIINTHLSIVSFQNYHELRHVEKINFNALALEKKGKFYTMKEYKQFCLMRKSIYNHSKRKSKKYLECLLT